MKRYPIFAAGLFFAAAIVPSVAHACSVVSDYRVPTNLELVEQSELIVRARVVGDIDGSRQRDNKLVVEPIEAIKGSMPAGTLEITGSGLVPIPDERGFGLLSNPYQLAEAHPLSYIGGCIRYMFPENTTVLFFLERRDGEWMPAGGPFSRWAEDVLDADAPWARLTRFYATVPKDDATQRKAMLEAERNRLKRVANDPVAALMAQDIERQLAGPNEPWNEIMRRAIDGDTAAPEGAAAEVAAEAAASLIMEEGPDEFPMTCFEDENGDMACETEVIVDDQAEVMEEEVGMVCDLLDDRRTVDCNGVRYVREDNAS